MKKWYKAVVPGGHVGTGRVEERAIYLYAEDFVKAQKILKFKTGGWKKSKGFLEIRTMKNDAEVDAVLANRKTVTKEQAMATGFLYADER